jgi:TolA-binding protein
VGDESSKVTVAANNMRDIKDALENMQRLQAITNEELRDSKGKIAMLENTVQQLLKSSEEKKKEDEEQNEMQDEEQGNNQNNQQHGALKDTQIQVYFPNYTLKRMVANLADTHLWVYLRVWNFVSTQQVLGPQSHHDGQHESTAVSRVGATYTFHLLT